MHPLHQCTSAPAAAAAGAGSDVAKAGLFSDVIIDTTPQPCSNYIQVGTVRTYLV